jgi:putative transposase
LAAWPLPCKADWVGRVNAAQTEAELLAVRRSIVRGSPLGDATWSEQTVCRLGLESTLRPPGRPTRKRGNGS